MLTKAIARALDSAGDGVGRVFAHYRVGDRLVTMTERMEAMEKRLKKLEKAQKTAVTDADEGNKE